MTTEFCCVHSWNAAKALAWKERDLNCGCDHYEYCAKCYPLDFRPGGKWDKYVPPAAPAVPAEQVAEFAVDRIRGTEIVEGESPAQLREAIAQRVADLGKPTALLSPDADLDAAPAVPAPAEPVTLADILDALNVFNRPKPSEDDGPWEAGHFIRVDHLPAFINIIAAAWFATPKPQAAQPAAQPSAEPVVWCVYVGDERMKSFNTEEDAVRWHRSETQHGSNYAYRVVPAYLAPQAQPAAHTQIDYTKVQEIAGKLGLGYNVLSSALRQYLSCE